MQEFIDFVGHAREYEFAEPSVWPRRALDPLYERRRLYLAQGRTWTDAGDMAVLAALHKKMKEGWILQGAEIKNAFERIISLEATVQSLLNRLGADAPIDFTLAATPSPADRIHTFDQMSPAQQRKHWRAHQRELATKRDKRDRLAIEFRKQAAKKIAKIPATPKKKRPTKKVPARKRASKP